MNKNKEIFSVPDGYFELLQTRLEAIPEQRQETHKHPVAAAIWSKTSPYFALAACFLLAFVIGNNVLTRIYPQQESEYTLEDWYYASLIPVTNPYAIYDAAPDTYAEESSCDDILEYLISSGASLDYISQILNQ